MDDTVILCLRINNQEIDLKIPTQITIKRFKELINDIFSLNLEDKAELVLLNKKITLHDDMLISMYPIANGDQIALITK